MNVINKQESAIWSSYSCNIRAIIMNHIFANKWSAIKGAIHKRAGGDPGNSGATQVSNL